MNFFYICWCIEELQGPAIAPAAMHISVAEKAYMLQQSQPQLTSFPVSLEFDIL